MGKGHRPRSGSLQFWPRKRAKNSNIRVRNWNVTKPSLLGFAGYKVGMTHVFLKDNRSNSLTKGTDICWPVTVIECPPIKIFSLRFYTKDNYGLHLAKEVLMKQDKELKRRINLAKKTGELNGIIIENYFDLRVNVYTQPKKTNIGTKMPKLFELVIGGRDIKQKYDYIRDKLDKELNVRDILKNGQFIDIHGITKGKGFQGSVKRFGVTLKAHKSEKKRRAIGNLGPWTPKRVSYTIGLPGKMGYHLRTAYNKVIILVGNDPSKINVRGGYPGYGLIKNDYVLVKGSIPGSKKRFVKMIEPIRGSKTVGNMELNYISLRSKQ